jgi:VWFA-related protein
MRTRLSTLSFVIVALATLTAQSAQSPRSLQPPETPQPVFRAESNFIRVDMYATEDGKFVTDLRPEEVEVYEDGVRQQVQTFEYVRIAPDGSDGSRPADEEEAPEAARSRVYVVYIDTHTTQLERESALRLSLVRFLDRLLRPNDLVGLMTPDMEAADVILGRRSTVISDVANDERWLRRSPDPREDLQEFAWENCFPSRGPGGPSLIGEMKARRRAKETIESLQDLVVHLRDLREERKAVLLVTAGWTFPLDSPVNRPGRNETESCRSDRVALMNQDFHDPLRNLTRAANRANVSFYPVNTRRQFSLDDFKSGFRGAVGMPAAVMLRSQRQLFEINFQQLKSLAEDTDGVAEPSTRNLDRVTQRIIDDTSSYYLLGYQSTNARADGRFRSITVKVQRPGVRVRAREGYGGEAVPVRKLRPAAPIVDSRVSFALGAVERFDALAPIWMRSAAWTLAHDSPGGAFWFVGEVGSEIRTRAPWTRGAIAELEVLGADKRPVFSRSVRLRPTDGSFSLRVPESGVLPAGDYSVRLKLQPAGDDATAVHDAMRVTIEETQSAPGPAVLWRRGASSRLEYQRTADPRFRRTERLRLELPTASDAAASVQLLDRFGQPLQIPALLDARPDASGAFRWILVEVPIAALAPGDYTVEVTQGDAEQLTAFRIVP